MIIVSTAAEDEAEDVSEALRQYLPKRWTWKVYLFGNAFRSSESADSEVC